MHGDDGLELLRLREENAELRAELARIRRSEQEGLERKGKLAIGFAKLLLPALDRYRVVRSFTDLSDTAARLTGPRDGWPTREELAARAHEFALACLKFTIRRRAFMMMLSLIAFLVPLSQVVLVYQQNRIIDNQNKYLDIQVYDTIASSLTGRDATGRYITSSLLAGVDFGLLNDMIQSVFATDNVGGSGGKLLLRETAARGHLVSSFGKALDRRAQSRQSDGTLGALGAALDRREWVQTVKTLEAATRPALAAIVADAKVRVPQLLQAEGGEIERGLEEECQHYFTHLNGLLRRFYSVYVLLDRRDEFFRTVAPLYKRAAEIGSLRDQKGPFAPIFRTELLIDVDRAAEFGAPPLPPPDGAAVQRHLLAGFRALEAAVNVHEPVEWKNLLPEFAR